MKTHKELTAQIQEHNKGPNPYVPGNFAGVVREMKAIRRWTEDIGYPEADKAYRAHLQHPNPESEKLASDMADEVLTREYVADGLTKLVPSLTKRALSAYWSQLEYTDSIPLCPLKYDSSGSTYNKLFPSFSDPRTPDKTNPLQQLYEIDKDQEEQTGRLDELVPEFRKIARENYETAIDSGWIPASVAEKLDLIDSVSVVPQITTASHAPNDSGRVTVGTYSDASIEIKLATKGHSATDMLDTFIHEVTHLLSGGLINLGRIKKGDHLKVGLYSQVGVISRQVPFATRWMNEALTEHIALNLIQSPGSAFNNIVTANGSRGGSWSYIDEREGLAEILETSGISVSTMIEAYFEDQAGYRKEHPPRLADIVMSQISNRVEHGKLKNPHAKKTY